VRQKRVRLIAARRSAGLTQEELAYRLGVERSTVGRWESGQTEPLAWLRRKLAAGLRVSLATLDELLAQPEQAASDDHAGALDEVKRRTVLKALGIGATTLPLADVHELARSAAHSSALLGASIETTGMDSQFVMHARRELFQLATDYALTSSLEPTMRQLLVLRDELYATVTTQHRPSETRDMYVLLGAACALLASISHDLSEPQAGLTQAGAAATFATLSGDRALLAWVSCTKAMIASWWGTPREVLRHAEVARAEGAVGIAAIRLAGLESRALAELGHKREAITVVQQAQDRREAVGEHDQLRELGEVFTFPLARQHYYSAATYLRLGLWQEVEQEASRVIDIYGTPTLGKSWPVTLTLSRIYQAQARLKVDGPEGAADAVQPLFAHPTTQVLPQTTQALEGLRTQLGTAPFASVVQARDLNDAVIAYTAGPVAQ